MHTVIEVSGLSMRYPGIQALTDVSLSVDEGSFVGLIGPNGAGKSTLISCILGLNMGYTGTVKIFGEDIRKSKKMLRKVGYVPQKLYFEKNFPVTAREVIRMGMWYGVREDRIDEILRELRIYQFADRRVGDLSGGQQQRVFIAKAMVNDPKLLIMDEPVTGVDQSSTLLFYDILRDLHNNHGITIVWSSHDLDAVNMLADHVACLDRKIMFHGLTKRFFSNEKLYKMHSEGSMYMHMREHRK